MIYYCVSNAVWAINSQGHVQWIVASSPPAPGVDGAQTSPIIAPNGTIYAGLGTRLYAIYSTNPPSTVAWPMYQQNSSHTGGFQKPSLNKPQKRSDSNIQFELFGQISNSYTIEASTNLNTWTSLTNFVATTLPMDVTDLTATNSPMKFYRALEVPGGK
jgi:hypothetical protein